MISWAPGLLEDRSENPQHGPYLTGGDATHLPWTLGERSTQRQMGAVFPRELLFFPSPCFPGVVR